MAHISFKTQLLLDLQDIDHDILMIETAKDNHKQHVSREQLRCWNVHLTRLREARKSITEKIARL